MAKIKAEPERGEEEQRMAEAEEMVPVQLPKTKEKSEPVLVQLGRYNAMIPRGVLVNVPKYVKLHLDECEAMDVHALKQLEKAQEAMNDMSAALGVTK